MQYDMLHLSYIHVYTQIFSWLITLLSCDPCRFNFEQVSSELQRIQARKPISVVANPSMVSKPVKVRIMMPSLTV